MSESLSTKQIVFNAAAQGDPAAFYSLFGSHVQGTYLAMRSSGKTHEQVLEVLLPFVARAYCSYVASPSSLAPEQWFEEKQAADLPGHNGISGEALDLEAVSGEELDDVDRKLQYALQREYGTRVSRTAHTRGRWWKRTTRKRMGLIVGMGAVLVLAAATTSLHLSGRAFELALVGAEGALVLRFPPGPEGFLSRTSEQPVSFREVAENPVPPVPDSAATEAGSEVSKSRESKIARPRVRDTAPKKPGASPRRPRRSATGRQASPKPTGRPPAQSTTAARKKAPTAPAETGQHQVRQSPPSASSPAADKPSASPTQSPPQPEENPSDVPSDSDAGF